METSLQENKQAAFSSRAGEGLQARDNVTVLASKDGNDLAYPRKQLRRASWFSLNGPWRFAYDDSGTASVPGEIKDFDRVIEVPFAPESEMSGIGDTGYHANCWYNREFDIPLKRTGRVILHFGAVDYRAKVWVNDHYIGCHEGGHTPFSFDIASFLKEGRQSITVWASDDPQDLAKPRGKQDWQKDPHSIWYPRTTGIWQSVWIEEVPETFIEKVRWSPHLERWEIGCEAFVVGDIRQGLQLRVHLSCQGKTLADDRYEVISGEVHRRIALSDPGIDDYRNELLWSPEKPTLIDAKIELLHDGKLIDQLQSYTALRGVEIQGERFILNNRPYYMRLVLDQGYWPESLMTPPSREAIIKDIDLVKAAGFNGVRKHQKIEDPDFLYWADVKGLLVWEEMPSAYRFTHDSVQRLMREWMEVIDRDMNHPCIVVWVPFNESWGVPDLPGKGTHRSCVQALFHVTRTLDPTRPVVGNDGWESSATDILGIHDYEADPAKIKARYTSGLPPTELLRKSRPAGRMLVLEGHPYQGQPVMLTEFGGIAYQDQKHDQERAWGYSVTRTAEDLRKRYHNLLCVVNQVELFAGFCYTQFTDTFQEANGLFFADRTPKFPLNELYEATRGPDRPISEVQLEHPPITGNA